MAIQKVSNHLIYGLSTDTKPTTYATNTLFYQTDTQSFYRWNGSTWSLDLGATKTETLTNKSLTNPNIVFDTATYITAGTTPRQAMGFLANGAIDFNGTTMTNSWFDNAGGTGVGFKIWDSDYSNYYKLGTGNLSADSTVTIPVPSTTSDTFELLNTAQTPTNKTISSSTNTLQGVAQDPIVKRTGRAQPITPSSAASAINITALVGAFAAHTGTGAGTNTITWDTTEGLISGYVSSAVANVNVGLVSPTTTGGIARRAFATKLRVRCKIDTVASSVSRLYVGFTSATSLPISDTPLAVADHGVIVGFSSADTTYQIYHNDGATSVTKDAVTGNIAKDTAYHTIEINWTAGGNVNVVFDGTSQTISADLPGTTTNLYLNIVGQTATAAARTLSLKGAWFESDK